MTAQETVSLFERLCNSAAAYGYLITRVRLPDGVEVDLLPSGPNALDSAAEAASRDERPSYGKRAAETLGLK